MSEWRADPVTGQWTLVADDLPLSRRDFVLDGANRPLDQPCPLCEGHEATAGREISKQDVDKAKEHIANSGLTTPIAISLTYESNRFWPQMAVFEATFVVLAFANAFGYAMIAARARTLFSSPAVIRGFNWTGGSLLVGAGIAAVTIRS